jgi:hypothetical protein
MRAKAPTSASAQLQHSPARQVLPHALIQEDGEHLACSRIHTDVMVTALVMQLAGISAGLVRSRSQNAAGTAGIAAPSRDALLARGLQHECYQQSSSAAPVPLTSGPDDATSAALVCIELLVDPQARDTDLLSILHSKKASQFSVAMYRSRVLHLSAARPGCRGYGWAEG